MQHRLGISGGSLAAAEYQLAGGLEDDALLTVRPHWAIGRIRIVLLVDYGSHALEYLEHLNAFADAVTKPVDDMLARDPQCRPIFHESNTRQIRHF